MKKITLSFALVLMCFNFAFSQANFLVEAPLDNSTTQVRAPNGLSTYASMRACALVLQSELTNIPAGTNITSFGFTLSTSSSVNVPVTGNFTVYLQNTNDVTYLKGTNFPTAITGMTSVYASTMTVPLSSLTTSIILTLSTPFTYTGGGIYVAYDWYSAGPYSTVPATYFAEGTALNPGCASGNSSTLPAVTSLTNTTFRPSFLFGGVNSYSNEIQMIGIECPGKVPAVLNSPHTIKAIVKNASNVTKTNVSVSLNVGGANVFTNVQNIASIAAGANATVNFAAFNPLLPGLNTVSVTLPSDQNNANNLSTYAQSVTCNTWALNPSAGSYTAGVGYGAGSGIIANAYLNPVTSTLTGLRAAISMDAATPGNSGYGVLLSAAGAIIATTNTISLTNLMLGTIQNFSFSLPQSLTANTTYYLGFAQTVGAAAYYPLGSQASPYISANAYVTSALNGGVLTALTQNLGYFGIEAVFAHSVSVSAISQSIVCGNSATVVALSNSNYIWNTGGTTSSIVVTPTVTSTYTVVATNTLGCSASAIANVTVNPITVSVSSSTNVICQGTTLTLTASGANSYSWTNGGTSSSIIVSPNVSTPYVVTGTNSAGCVASGFIAITVNALPNISVLSSTQSVCDGSPVSYTASGANSYLWNTGDANAIVTFTPPASASYSVIGTSVNGCTNVAIASIIVNTFTLSVTANTSICNGATVSLNASGAFSYNWIIGNGYPFPSTVVSPSTSTIYTVIGTDLYACTITKTVGITVNPNPTLSVVATKTIICSGETANATVSGANTYSWTNTASGSVIASPTLIFLPTLASNQTFSVIGFNANNCFATASLTIKVNACLGINEKQTPNVDIRIFPNPNNGIFTIQKDAGLEKNEIRVYNTLGMLVKQLNLDTNGTSIDLQNENNGIYFIHILENNKTIYSSKIVKQ